jgi:predicted acyltransferase
MKNRLDSLDILRGFDMFFITGGAGFIAGIFTALGCCPFMVKQMEHVSWQGLAHHDTIFPLFLFLSGVSWPFSYSSQVAHGKTQGHIHLKLFVRVVTLFLLGLSFGGFLAFNPNFRLMSVLGFIGISWGIAALLYIHIKKNVWRIVTVGALLVGYWALLRFFHAPDAPAEILAGALGTYAKETNIVTWFDRVCFTNHLMVKVGKGFLYEPESLFSVTNGAALALLGMLAGTILRNENLAPIKKAGSLLGCAFVCLTLDFLFIYIMGDVVVKALWTSSFVLSSAVYSFFMLAAFYFVVDVKGYSKWGVIFRCIGRNSILIYLMNLTGVTGSISRWIFRGVRAHSGDWQQAVTGLTFFIAAWAILYYLDRKKIYLKV